MRRALTLMALVALVGCDETRVRTGASELTTLENDAIRVLVSSDGIGRLVEVANAGGFPLVAPSLSLDLSGGATGSLGPLEQNLGVSSRTSTPGTESVSLTTRLDGSSVFVPVRIQTDAETRICRWRLDTTRIETTASLVLIDGDNGQEFGVEDTPLVALNDPVATAVDNCSDLESLLPADFHAVLADYVQGAIASSAAASLPSSPLDILGLLRGNVQLSKRSAFTNRTGTLVIESDVSPRPDALDITPDGLSIAIDAAAEADRARCAPPTAIEETVGGGAGALDPADVNRLNADFAIAISRSWLARVAQGATLAGFACRGLEDAREPEINTEVVATADVLLEEIGLDNVPTGPFSTLTLAPGSLPRLELRPGSGTIGIIWDDLQVEVYSEVFGARTRLARVVADAEFGLGPSTQIVGVAKFDIDSIDVTTDRIDSEFLAVDPQQEDLDRWMRRTLLNMLEERFAFPLPLDPAAPVRVVSIQVRTNDIVAFMRFD